MKELVERIKADGQILDGNILKVDGFLNHQIDIHLMKQIGQEFYRLYKDENITKILTIEASGIAIASFVADAFDVPLLFAKKSQSTNLGSDVYTSKVYSYTHNREYTITVSKKYMHENDRFLIIDDFMANGCAAAGLCEIVEAAHANVAGIGIVIEKGFQHGGAMLRDRGYRVESLAIVEEMDPENQTIRFRDDD